ncbi:MAG: adenylyltransferase/cytidyltransferase family protein [Candidatus Sungbacteria bacterium]|uniref:Adenylyltransferase/cytidyltransferase family protein n=1 Tax=Candidatus Sungiibacteriota bacterium TaxID=2750080 RepID=A0A9D6LSA0_9BACT|nr:adenylyltransferase/cytidyltransferase family protein [Candidatus Sungbacteria bacterium]
MRDLFGPRANFGQRCIRELPEVGRKLDALRELDPSVVIGLTSGTFDMLHLGHSRYLDMAKQFCDILVVGVDADAKVRKRKGPKRPVVSEEERYEIVCNTRQADIVVPKLAEHPRWELVRTARPHVLIISEREYVEGDEREELRQLVSSWGGKLEILPTQAETSTTARIRVLMLEVVDEFEKEFMKFFERFREALRVM